MATEGQNAACQAVTGRQRYRQAGNGGGGRWPQIPCRDASDDDAQDYGCDPRQFRWRSGLNKLSDGLCQYDTRLGQCLLNLQTGVVNAVISVFGLFLQAAFQKESDSWMKVQWQAAPFWLSGDQPRNYVSDCSATPRLSSRQHLEQEHSQNAHISALLSVASPRACSGDMYAAVPRMTPCWVACILKVGDWERSTSASPANALARSLSAIRLLKDARRRIG